MKIDDEVMTEEEFDERLNRSYQVGISEGLLKAKHIMLAKAHAYFETRQDELASRYRDIAEEFGKLANVQHPGVRK